MGLGAALLAAIAAGLLAVQHRRGATRVDRSTQSEQNPRGGLPLLVAVLVVVAVQEEVLFRGYVTLNLIRFGWPVVLVVSTVSFVAVHLIANRVNPTQILRWTLFGGTLGVAYLLSGSIWVPTALHLNIDLLNVVAFGIAGRYAVVTLTPPLTERAQATHGVIVSVAVTVLLLGTYGPAVGISPDQTHPPPTGASDR